MARKPKSESANDIEPNNSLVVEQGKDETGAQATARKLLQPAFKNAAASSAFIGRMLGANVELPGLHDYATAIHIAGKGAAEGDLAVVSQVLASHVLTLDAMFAEYARRSANNMGDYSQTAERYGRLALKAQSNCRATLEALAKLHQPRERTVRHVHVNEGGQAVVTEHFHNHQSAAGGAVGSEQASDETDRENKDRGNTSAGRGQRQVSHVSGPSAIVRPRAPSEQQSDGCGNP